MIIKRLLFVAEILGVITLIFVLLGTNAVTNDVQAMTHISPELRVWIFVLLTGIFVAIPLSLLRIFGYKAKSSYRTAFGVSLIFIGSIVVYLIPAYFYTLIALPTYFWYKVSIFSLPAICIDGGLFTLFTEMYESKKGLSPREQYILGSGFVIYTVLAVSVNFLVLLLIWNVEHQIDFYRLLILFTTLIFVTVVLKKNSKTR